MSGPFFDLIPYCLGVIAVTWLLSVITREYSWVDRVWSIAPPVSGYRMARLRIPGTNVSWLLEARRRTGAFDAALPGDAVIVHEERPDRWEDLWAYDAAVPPGDSKTASASTAPRRPQRQPAMKERSLPQRSRVAAIIEIIT